MTNKPTDAEKKPQSHQSVRFVKVGAERAGQRLDNLLARELKGAPKSLIYRLIRKGQVRINGGRCKPHQRLDNGDEVRIPPIRLGQPKQRVVFEASQLASIRQQIIEQDKRFLAVDKPAGMAVHAGSGIRWGLIDLLRAALSEQYLELAHRIDRGTSGVVLLAKQRPALLTVQRLLKTGQVSKRYLCLLHGRLPEQQLTVRAPLRKVGDRSNSRVIVADDGKPAISTFTELQRVGQNTFAQCEIVTGRTHQVRVHAAHIGLPLLGDGQYGGPKVAGLNRPALHCASMAFDDEVTFSAQAPLAEDLRRIVDSA